MPRSSPASTSSSRSTYQGVRPEKVKLHYSVDGGKFFAVKDFEPGTNYYDPWQVTLTNVQQTHGLLRDRRRRRVAAVHAQGPPRPDGDLRSRSTTSSPTTPGSRRGKDIEGGNVEAIDGTKVTVHATTNEPARQGTLNLTADTPAPMTVRPDDAHQLTGKFKVTKSGTYTISFRTTGGQLNPNPVVYDIIAIEDRRPGRAVPAARQADREGPGQREGRLRDDRPGRPRGEGRHPSRRPGNEPPSSPRTCWRAMKPPPSFRVTETLDLAPLRLKPGEKLSYWLTVRDTREPTSNKAETPRQLIEITAPVAPPEQKQIDEKREKDLEQFKQPPPPAETEQPQQPEPGDAGTQDQQQGGQDEKGNPNPENGAGTGAGEKGKGQEPQDRNAGPDQGQGTQPGEGQQGKDQQNEGGPSPQNDPQFQKLRDGLQKKGKLNPEPERQQAVPEGQCRQPQPPAGQPGRERPAAAEPESARQPGEPRSAGQPAATPADAEPDQRQ